MNMNKDYLRSRFPMLMLVFAFGGIFGFVYEEIFYRFDLGEWVKRGTTFGPWIPIYGFGAIIILGMTFKFRKNPLLVFLFATIASGVLELVTGWVLLKFFGVRLWDYNTEILNWGNINGLLYPVKPFHPGHRSKPYLQSRKISAGPEFLRSGIYTKLSQLS